MADLSALSGLAQFWDLGFHLLTVKSKVKAQGQIPARAMTTKKVLYR